MATKQELEAKVAELEAKLASVAEGASLTIPSRLSQEEIDAFIAKVKDEHEAQLRNVRAERDDLVSMLKEVSARGEGVVLDGVPHVIIQRERMLDLVDAWRKRFVDDDALVLVVKKA
jgi:hypothetical protein